MFSMPTPTATMREDFERVERLKEKGATTIYSRANNPDGTGRHHGLLTYMGFYDLLPTPITCDFMDGTAELRKDTGKQRVDSLKHLMAALTHPNPSEEAQEIGRQLGMIADTELLATPRTSLYKVAGLQLETTSIANRPNGNLEEVVAKVVQNNMSAEHDGPTSRLSPLFTEEMMGFPLMWTALPFLSESGAPKPSKPTATPSSPK